MVQTVKLENGEVHEFPDNATPQQMSEAINTMQSDSDNAAVKKAIIDKFNYATGNNRTPLDTLRDLGAGAISGLGKGGQFIASKLTGGYAPTVDMDQMTAPIASPNQSIGGQITKGVGSYLPYGAAGGASLVGQTLAGGASGLANTGDQESNLFGLLPSGKTGGAIEGALLNALTHGAFEGLQALRPSKMFRGNLSPEQLQRNVNITQGTETGLGDVIQSPYLKRRLENTLTNVPLSGANESLQRTGNLVVDKGNDLLKQMLGDNESYNIPQKIADDLTEQSKLHTENKENLYEKVNNIADENNLFPTLTKFKNALQRNKSALNNINILGGDPLGQNLFEKISNSTGVLEKQNTKNIKQSVQVPDENIAKDPLTGQPLQKQPTIGIQQVVNKPINNKSEILGSNALPITYKPSYRETNILKGRLNQYANIARQSPDVAQRALANVYDDLGKSLRSDVHDSISGSGHAPLINAYNVAEENYQKNFSPFLDKEIYKYTHGKKDAETIISNFIKTSRADDLAGRLSKLANKLPDQSKPLLGYSYFSRALDNEGNLNPAKLGTLYSKLGKNQLKVLVPDQEMRRSLSNYVKLQGMNKEAQYLMFNPKTGQRNTDALITGLLALGGHLATGNIKGAATAVAAPLIAGRYTTKALTSPQFREALVKAMIENKSWNPNALKGIQAGVQGLVNR